MLTASDDFSAVVPVAESMLCARGGAARSYAAGLYAALFQLHGGQEARRARLLRGLVGRATAVAPPPEPTGKVGDRRCDAPLAVWTLAVRSTATGHTPTPTAHSFAIPCRIVLNRSRLCRSCEREVCIAAVLQHCPN